LPISRIIAIINHNSYIIAEWTLLALASALIAARFRQHPAAWIGLIHEKDERGEMKDDGKSSG
jgi:hypothetical protein